VVEDGGHSLRLLEPVLCGGRGTQVLEIAEAGATGEHVQELDMAGLGVAGPDLGVQLARQRADIANGERKDGP